MYCRSVRHSLAGDKARMTIGCVLAVLCLAFSLIPGQASAAQHGGALRAQSTGTLVTSQTHASAVKAAISGCASGRAGSITIKAGAVKGTLKYQFAVAENARFSAGKQIKPSNSNVYTFNYLHPAATYYVKARVCTKVNGKATWGPWSAAKSVKTRALLMGFVSPNSVPGGAAVNWWKNCGFKIVGITSPNDPDLKRVAGVLVPGGKDINPKYYGAKKHPRTVLENPKVDALKMAVTRKCAQTGMPFLGICGGEQYLNVALGGTLNQHIKAGYHSGWRKIRISKRSWLYPIWGSVESTNHSHHQCVQRLGKGLIATQWDAKDGTIEAVEHVSLPLYGVQYHPENMGANGRRVGWAFARVCMRHSR